MMGNHEGVERDALLREDDGAELADRQETALRMVRVAFDQTASARMSGPPELRVRSQRQLQDAVDEARDVGVGWERIGASLGIARGNAYQRFRKRPT